MVSRGVFRAVSGVELRVLFDVMCSAMVSGVLRAVLDVVCRVARCVSPRLWIVVVWMYT